MKLFKVMIAIAVIALLTSPAYAAVGVKNNGSTIGTATDIDFSTNIDASSDGSKVTVTLDNTPVVTGDVTFRSTLVAIGREGGASTVSSSSTNIDPVNQAYTVVRKCIGSNGGKDETGVGTILENGTPGKVLVLVAIVVDTDGSWIVTPRNSKVMTNVVLDAVGEMITLVYFSDTVGWVPMSVEGATVTYNVNSFTS